MVEHRIGNAPRVPPWLVAFVLPLLLALPAIAILQWQTARLGSFEVALEQEIDRLETTLPETRSFDRVRAMYLARRSIVNVLQQDRPRLVRLLNALGTLPPGVRLHSVTVAHSTLTLGGSNRVPSAPSDAVAALQAAGLEDVTLGNTTLKDGSTSFEIRADVRALTPVSDGPLESEFPSPPATTAEARE